jgi:hypothetical protein
LPKEKTDRLKAENAPLPVKAASPSLRITVTPLTPLSNKCPIKRFGVKSKTGRG